MKQWNTLGRTALLTALLVLSAAPLAVAENSKTKMLAKVNSQISSMNGQISTLSAQSSDLDSKSTDLAGEIATARAQMERDTTEIKTKRDRIDYMEAQVLFEIAGGANIKAMDKALAADRFRLQQIRDKHLSPIRKQRQYLELVKKRKNMEFDLELARSQGDPDALTKVVNISLKLDEQIVAYEDKAVTSIAEYKALSAEIDTQQSHINALRDKVRQALSDNVEWAELNAAVDTEQKALSRAFTENQKRMREKHQADVRIEKNNATSLSLSQKVAFLEKQKKNLEIALAHDLVDSTD